MSMSNTETLGVAYDAIKALCEKRMKATIRTALAELRANKMSTERAFHLCMEMNATSGLLRSVEVALKVKPTEETENG